MEGTFFIGGWVGVFLNFFVKNVEALSLPRMDECMTLNRGI